MYLRICLCIFYIHVVKKTDKIIKFNFSIIFSFINKLILMMKQNTKIVDK